MDTAAEATSIVLSGDRLKVEIAKPGEFYNGTRFDWSGFITQVTLDGQHTYCMPESLWPGRGTGGSGLCNEFGIEKPIGYDETPVGGTFPKFGVGLLRRPDDGKYMFARPYEIVDEFPIIYDIGNRQATFFVEPLACQGYAARLKKTINVSGAELTISYLLENVGDRDIVTHEYCHNFLRLDDHNIGPDYVLRMPYDIELEQIGGMVGGMLPRWMRGLIPGFILRKLGNVAHQRMLSILSITHNEIRWNDYPTRAFYCRLMGYHQTEEAQWTLIHKPSGVQVQEYDDFEPSRVAVWGVEHVVSAEVFIDIDIKPGESASWSRRYQFTGT
jgi:hypothetical protein